MASSGVRLSELMVTGRQKLAVSELKRLKASCSSAETRRGKQGLYRNKDTLHLDAPVIPDCMMPRIGGSWGLIEGLLTERGE